MDIHLLHRRGLSIRQISRRLHIGRNTVRKYLREPFLENRLEKAIRPSKLDGYLGRINNWLEEDEFYTATWIYDHLRKQGFTGSYSIVKRKVHDLREDLSRKAYIAFETEPGRQAQVDFGEFQVDMPDGTVKKYYVFSMVLGYSRRLYAELIESCDLPTFLDCHIRAFKFFGGVPLEILYDRMRNVYIRNLTGVSKFNDTLTGFALHYRFKPLVAPAFAPWVKGKVERPYDFIRNSFWRGYGFTYLDTANRDLMSWLLEKETRIHGTTHQRIDERFLQEASELGSLPGNDFDTSWRVYRKVYKDCTVHFECNRYVVSHKLVGKKILLRVKDDKMRVFADNELLVEYKIPEGKGHLIQDPKFYAALRADKEQNRRKYGEYRIHKGRAKHTISPLRMKYDMDVMIRPVTEYEQYREAV